MSTKLNYEPDDELKCVICLEVAREPFQHEECGKLLCKECLEEYGRDKPYVLTAGQAYNTTRTIRVNSKDLP